MGILRPHATRADKGLASRFLYRNCQRPPPPTQKSTDQNGSGITEPVSPGLLFTETTVALGKKLNSDALAQV